MRKLSLFITLLFLSKLSIGAISISIVSPAFLADSTNISVAISSTYEMKTVTAEISGRSVKLKLVAGKYTGYLLLKGLPEGDSLALTITATDALNNMQTLSKSILYDNPPEIKLVNPISGSVARPAIYFKMYCKDLDSCVLKVHGYGKNDGSYTLDNTFLSKNIKDSIETMVDFSQLNGFYTTINVEVYDKNKQGSSSIFNLYVDSSKNLTEIYADATGTILDFNYDKILFQGTDRGIVDVNTLEKAKISAGNGYLTPSGAFYTNSNSGTGYVIDLNNGKSDTISVSGRVLQVEGNYALWSDNQGHYRNISLKKDFFSIPYFNYGDISSAGTIAYSYMYNSNQGNDDVLLYSNNKLTQITHNKNNSNPDRACYGPSVDGDYVAFLIRSCYVCRFCYDCYPDSIGLYDGKNIVFTTNCTPSYDVTSYQVKNKFLAYTKRSDAGFRQVWLRDSAGNNNQITFFSTSSRIEMLNERGSVMINDSVGGLGEVKPRKRTLVLKNGISKEICSALGKVYYYNSMWYVAIGGTLFRVNVDETLPFTLLSFSGITKNGDNILNWITTKEINTSYFSLERSADTKNFVAIGKILATGNNSLSKSYSFKDISAFKGINYYRLKSVDKDGSFSYSKIVKLGSDKALFTIKLSSNPVHNNLSFQINSAASFKLHAVVTNLNGSQVLSSDFNVEQGSLTKSLNITNIAPGVYFLTIAGDKIESRIFKIVKL